MLENGLESTLDWIKILDGCFYFIVYFKIECTVVAWTSFRMSSVHHSVRFMLTHHYWHVVSCDLIWSTAFLNSVCIYARNSCVHFTCADIFYLCIFWQLINFAHYLSSGFLVLCYSVIALWYVTTYVVFSRSTTVLTVTRRTAAYSAAELVDRRVQCCWFI